jgi:hypothetical protein
MGTPRLNYGARRISSTAICSGPNQFTDLLFDLVHFGKAIQCLLGENLSPVEKDFERSRLTGSKRHRPELIVVIVQQILRQTGGSR